MKKLISILMSIVLIFSVMAPVYAAPNMENPPAKIENYDGYPLVVVRGINFGGLYNKNTGESAMKIEAADVFDFLLNFGLGKLKLKNENALADSLVDFLWAIMGDMACDKNGNSANPAIVAEGCDTAMINHADFLAKTPYKNAEGVLQSAVARLGGENVYFLNFDWRSAPVDLAAKLNALVETAKKDSGKDKVKIICCSMGAMATTAYFYYYNGKSVDSCTYLSGAHNGGYVAGEALNGNLKASPEAIDSLVRTLTNGNTNIFLKFISIILNFLGFYDGLADVVNDVLKKNLDKIYDEALLEIFGCAVGLWGLCPDDVFDSGVEFFFGDKRAEYSTLLAKINECRTFTFSTEATLAKAEADGVKLSFVTNYNKGLIPLYPGSTENGDIVLEAKLTSNGATIAPTGKTLSAAQISAANPAYLSADKVIDASTCLYPNQTWFVKNASHVGGDYGTEFSDFVFKLALYDGQPTITTFADYPQFMIADGAYNLSPLK